MRNRTMLVMATAAAVLVSGVIAVAAQAGDQESVHCTFAGRASVDPGVQWGPSLFVGWAHGTGQNTWANDQDYSFTSVVGLCSISNPHNPEISDAAAAAPTPVTITSDGDYRSAYCGGGMLSSGNNWAQYYGDPADDHSGATITANGSDPDGEYPININYYVYLSGGIGDVKVTGGSHGDGTGAVNQEFAPQLGGTTDHSYIAIHPDSSQGQPDPPVHWDGAPNSTGVCAYGFTIEGDVSFDLNDDGNDS